MSKFFKNIYNEIDFFLRRNLKFTRPIKKQVEITEKHSFVGDLENYISVEKDNAKILDIGAKNWFYAKELYDFFKYNNFEKEIWLDGIEIDAYRLYNNLHSRYDYAMYYSKGLKNCRYLVGDFLQHNEKYDYITWFYPFVSETPLLAWGLPLSTLKPLKMLEHAVASLNPGGIIIIKNQNEKEFAIQEKLFQTLDLPYKKESKCLITISQNIS